MSNLLTFLLIAQVACEWVEISQQRYRKPVRITHHYPTESIEGENPYANHSTSEYNWNKGGVRRVPNLGNIKRVQIPAGNVRQSVKHTTVTDKNELGNAGLDKGHVRNEEIVGSVERVPNIGKVNRVQLADTPVKSPALKIRADNSKANPNIGSKDKVTESVKNERKDANRESYFGYKNEISTEKIPILTTEREDTHVFINGDKIKYEYKNFSMIKYLSEPTPTFVTESDKFNYNDNFDNGATDIKTKVKLTSDINFKDTLEATKNTASAPIAYETERSKSRIRHKNTQPSNSVIKGSLAEDDTDKLELENRTNKSEIAQDRSPKPLQVKHTDDIERVNDAGNKIEMEVAADTKANSIETLMQWMKTITDTISKNTRRNFNSKMRYLQELKDSLLANIEHRIDSTWPDDNDRGPSRRRARVARDTGRGHVEFPSSESALMTISFLTFAVFLIKLVLQVIQTYKDKTMLVAPLVVASAGRAARKHLRTQRGHN